MAFLLCITKWCSCIVLVFDFAKDPPSHPFHQAKTITDQKYINIKNVGHWMTKHKACYQEH